MDQPIGLFTALLLLFSALSFPIKAIEQPLEKPQTPITINLRIAKLNWCPQICPRGEQAGYMIDILDEAFKDSQFSLTYKTMSYPEARAMTADGKFEALVGPAKKEAPLLVFPSEHIGYQRVCFYTKAESEWNFTDENSLKDLMIGIAIDISLEEVNDYIHTHKKQFVFQAESKRFIDENLRLLEIGRLDTFVFNENSVFFYMRKNGWHDRVRTAGCVSAVPTYLAFSPKMSADQQKAIQYLDQRIRELKKSGFISAIMERYGLPDWSKIE